MTDALLVFIFATNIIFLIIYCTKTSPERADKHWYYITYIGQAYTFCQPDIKKEFIYCDPKFLREYTKKLDGLKITKLD